MDYMGVDSGLKLEVGNKPEIKKRYCNENAERSLLTFPYLPPKKIEPSAESSLR